MEQSRQQSMDIGPHQSVAPFEIIVDLLKWAPPTAIQLALQNLYVAYFSRPADPGGLAYWRAALDSGKVTLAQVGEFMAEDAEYKAIFRNPDGTGMNEMQSVNAVYINLFGREAEPAGLFYWSNAMKAGQVTIADVVVAIGSGAQASDLAALKCKTLFAHYLTNSLDTASEILSYSGANVVAARLVMSTITSQETLDIALAGWGQDDMFVIGGGQRVLLADSPTVTEGDSGNKLVTFTLTLDQVPTRPVTISYETVQSGAAKAGEDFVVSIGTVTFAAGQRVAMVTISIIGDTVAEQSETFSVRFSSPSLMAEHIATATIIDNDAILPGSSIPAYDAALLDSYAPYDAGDTAADQSLLILVGINSGCI